MIKLISYTYILANGTPDSVNLAYCEIKNVQSPYIAKINDCADKGDMHAPVYTCDLLNDPTVKPSALLKCIKRNNNWLKI